MLEDCVKYSEYTQGTRTGTTVKHKNKGYWGVHLIDTKTSNSGFLMWHPTKSESWVEDIAENFCFGMINQDGTIPND